MNWAFLRAKACKRPCCTSTICSSIQNTSIVCSVDSRRILGRQGHSHARIACCIVAPAVAPDRIPLSLLAIAGGLLVGTINLVESDDENRLHLRPWLAALFIIPDRRRQGIGSMLVRDLQHRAANLGVPAFYRGTDRLASTNAWARPFTTKLRMNSPLCSLSR